jgi:hypothetical protein
MFFPKPFDPHQEPVKNLVPFRFRADLLVLLVMSEQPYYPILELHVIKVHLLSLVRHFPYFGFLFLSAHLSLHEYPNFDLR